MYEIDGMIAKRQCAMEACLRRTALAVSGLSCEEIGSSSGVGKPARKAGCIAAGQNGSHNPSRMGARMRVKLWRRPWEHACVLLMCCLGTWPRCASGQSMDVAGEQRSIVEPQLVQPEG